MKNYMINSLIEFTKYKTEYRIEIMMVVTDDLDIPSKVKAQYNIGDGMMLLLNNQCTDLEFDFGTSVLSWNTTFGGVPYNVGIPVQAIKAIKIDEYSAVQFHDLGNQTKQPHTPVQKETVERPELKLTSYNADIVPEKSSAKLNIV